MRCTSVGLLLSVQCLLAATQMSAGTEAGTVHFVMVLLVSSQSAHTAILDRGNVLFLHLTARVHESTVFTFHTGNRELAHVTEFKQFVKILIN
jgi:hypothetical protein